MKLRRESISAGGVTSSHRQFSVWSGGETYPEITAGLYTEPLGKILFIVGSSGSALEQCRLQNSFSAVYEINSGKGAGDDPVFCSSVGFSVFISFYTNF